MKKYNMIIYVRPEGEKCHREVRLLCSPTQECDSGSYWVIEARQQEDMADGRKWKMDQKDQRGRGVSSNHHCLEKSIHHFHILVLRLTLAVAESAAMKTQRIDEVQAGVAGRGLGVEMVKPDVAWGGAWDGPQVRPVEGHDVTYCHH